MADRKMNAEINVEFEEAATRQSLNSGDSVNTLFGKIKKFFSDLKPVAFSGDAETVNGHTVESNIPALGYYYATCDSPLTTNIKTVTCEGFEFKEGARITICFTTGSGGTPPSTSIFILKINDDTGRPIAYNDWWGEGTLTPIQSQKSEAFCSKQVWDFIFINGRFIMQAPLRGYQMDTALSDFSSNPVENKVIKTELDKKANTDDIPTFLPANGGNADTVGKLSVSNFRGTNTGYVLSSDNGEFKDSHNVDDFINEYHGFVFNYTNTPTNYGFLDVDRFEGTGFAPYPNGIIRQTWTHYNDPSKIYRRLYLSTSTTSGTWTTWAEFSSIKSITVTNKVLTNGTTYLFSSNQLESRQFDNRKILGIKCESTNLRLYEAQLFRNEEWQIRFHYYNDITKILTQNTDVSYTVYYID